MLSTKLKEAAGNSADATLYVDDVFSTYLYTGNGSTQTITNGIDLAGKGGLVWGKDRSATGHNFVYDTARGVTNALFTNLTNAQNTGYGDVTSFNSNGFSLNGAGGLNLPGDNTASWTFRKAAKFFDVQTVTHTNGTANNIDLSVLGTVGMVIAKITSNTGDWTVWQRSLTASNNLKLNTTAAQSTTNAWISVSGTTATLAAAAPTGTYVIYAYAHDTSSTGIIQCGSFTTDVISTFPPVNLGWEPQYLMIKTASASGFDWTIFDSMRGLYAPNGQPNLLAANTSAAETQGEYIYRSATGFYSDGTNLNASTTYIYMAIRMPNKPPTTGTQVYNAIARNGANFVETTITSVGFPTDTSIVKDRDLGGVNVEWCWQDRLRAIPYWLQSPVTDAETYDAQNITTYGMNGVTFGTNLRVNGGTIRTYINWFFKRAPGFYDEVCYTGTGSATTQAHNLTVVPELMIVKERSAVNNWWVYVSSVGNTKYSVLNSTATPVTSSTAWNNTTPTASVFSIGTGANVNASTQTFVAYLFATLAGISKVGSYTGNGTGQAIACGFSAGARFVLIKRTDSTGDWYTYDSARGLTSGSSPYLLLNSTAAEVTGNNGVYASTGGFTLGATAITTTNIASATYIFLAVA